jgi:hypothetical protein
LDYISLTLDIKDGSGNLPGRTCSAAFVPSAVLTDAGVAITDQAPVNVAFSGVSEPSVSLLPTDAAGPMPAGWTWGVTFSGTGMPGPFSFFLPAGADTFTATDASPCVFTLAETDAPFAGTGVQISGGSLPAGFEAGTTYYVTSPSGSTYSLAATLADALAGTALASTSTGSGSVVTVSQVLSSLIEVESGTAFQAYMLQPSGTPSAGQVPVATGVGEASAWGDGGGGGGSGTVTSVSVATANGFAGTVANPTTTPAITMKTSVTGILKGNGTSVSAATAGTDYLTPAEGLQVSNNLDDVGTRQTALNNLAGAVTSGDYLRGNGSNVQMSAIQAGDVPTLNQNTTGTAANITDTLDQVPAPAANVSLNSHKITNLANGSSGTDAAAFGQLPSSGTPLALTQGGTGVSAASDAALLADLGAAALAGAAFTGEVTVQAPVNPSDAVTKSYADAIAQGLSVKASVQEATAAALPSNTYANGSSGVGATLTATTNGALTVDGVSVALNDRVLVQNEASAAHNGIYSVTTLGTGSVPYVLTRTADFDTASQIPGAFVFCEQGTANAGAGFVVASEGPFTVGTTAITWTQFSGAGEITAGSGLSKSGNTLSLATALPNGTTATTQSGGDSSTKVATDAFVAAAVALVVQSVTAGDTSIVVGGSATAPTIETGTLDVIAADHPPAANWSNNSHKITSVANGSSAQDAAAYGQTPAGGNTATIAQGGTGQTSASAAFNALSPLTTIGDTLYGGSSGAGTRLAGSTSSTKNFLTQTGTGSASAAPAWGTIAAGDIPTLNQNTTGSSGSCTGNAATATNLAGGATLPDYLAPAVAGLTFVGSGTTLVNAALGNAFSLTLTASTTTLGNPSNPVDGQVIRFRITQGSGGSFTLSYGSNYDFGAAGQPTLSTTAAKVDILAFEYVGSISKWCFLGAGLGY